MRPRIGPAHGAHNRPVGTPGITARATRAVRVLPPAGRRPSATDGRAIECATGLEIGPTPSAASSTNAAIRPYELRRTAHAPPTAASVAMPAKVTAIPTSIGSVLRAKDLPGFANTNGSTGRMHGLMM